MRGRARGPVLALIAGAGIAGCAGGEEARPLPALGEPMTVVSAGASNPTAALRPDGHAVVAWVGATGERHDVYTAVVAPDGTISGPFRVNDRPGDAAPHGQAPARVVTGGGGDVWVIWPNSTPVEGRRFPASDLRWAHSTDGGQTFGPTGTVNGDAGGVPASHTFHNAVVDAEGRLVVSWLDSRADWARVAEAAGWSPGDPPPGDPADGEPGAGPSLYVGVSSAGASPGAALPPFREAIVTEGTCPCCRTNLARGPGGELYVSWRAILPGSIRDVVVSRSDDGGATWGEPVRVHADDWVFDGCPHAGPGLDVGADGRVHVAWYTGHPDAPGLYYATSSDGAATFTPPVPLTHGFAIPSQARVSPEGAGALVAWEVRGDGAPRVRVARASAEGVGPAATVEGELPEWALGSGDDSALLTWLDGAAVRAAWVARAPLPPPD